MLCVCVCVCVRAGGVWVCPCAWTDRGWTDILVGFQLPRTAGDQQQDQPSGTYPGGWRNAQVRTLAGY